MGRSSVRMMPWSLWQNKIEVNAQIKKRHLVLLQLLITNNCGNGLGFGFTNVTFSVKFVMKNIFKPHCKFQMVIFIYFLTKILNCNMLFKPLKEAPTQR